MVVFSDDLRCDEAVLLVEPTETFEQIVIAESAGEFRPARRHDSAGRQALTSGL